MKWNGWLPSVLCWPAKEQIWSYHKTPKNSDTPKNYCNSPKIWLIWIVHRVMCLNDADGMANSVDPDQTAPWHSSRSSLIWVYTVYSDLSVHTYRNITVAVVLYWLKLITVIFTLPKLFVFKIYTDFCILHIYIVKELFKVCEYNCNKLLSHLMTKPTKWLCSSEDSDQHGHLPGLIRVFAVRIRETVGPKLPTECKRKLLSDWEDAQAHLSLCWAHMPFCWFCRVAAHFKNTVLILTNKCPFSNKHPPHPTFF